MLQKRGVGVEKWSFETDWGDKKKEGRKRETNSTLVALTLATAACNSQWDIRAFLDCVIAHVQCKRALREQKALRTA